MVGVVLWVVVDEEMIRVLVNPGGHTHTGVVV